MFSVRRCREILGRGCSLSDSEIELLQDQLYALANVTFDAFQEEKRQGDPTHLRHTPGQRTKPNREGVKSFAGVLSILPEAEKYELDERAALMEFEGNLTRDEAERAALLDWSRRRAP